jgi:hypothetical protein
MKYKLTVAIVLLLLIVFPISAAAQDYYFSLPNYTIDVYWNSNGTLSIDYLFEFDNSPQGHRIEYVDVGLPNTNFSVNNIYAEVNGTQVTDISRGGYEGQGVGVAVGLGQHSIPPGGRGQVRVFIDQIERVIYPDDEDEAYASAVFSTAFFGSRYTFGSTNMTVYFHLPPGVQPEEPRWHRAPAGFPQEPETGFDDEGRIVYAWRNPNARPDQQYTFGASFPREYIPEGAIVTAPGVDPFGWLGTVFSLDCLIPLACFGLFGLIFIAGIAGERKRKLKYLPPKIAIEGHGIKRGLTAVEAAILMEQPMDKVLTMILFGLIKKDVARVISREDMKIETRQPLPEGLRSYEVDFIEAFKKANPRARQAALQETMINLIKSVSQKMKGFSHKETVAFYRDIMERSWKQVEAADTPEVKSQKFDENMEWTMLDRDYDRRTRDVFRTGPVFVPMWWGRYDPNYGRGAAPTPGPAKTAAPTAGPAPAGAGRSLPTLPGGEFAASMVGGVQNFSSKVVGNITDFTGKVTGQTNPPPKPPSGGGFRGGGGGGGCACACACAGCACACAGGGR